MDARTPVGALRHQSLGDLDIFPYVRGRLVFAHLVAKRISEDNYDYLLVDLPFFMNNPAWLRCPLAFFPHVALAIFQRFDGERRVIPFSPNDAGCITAYLALKNSIPLHCLDDSDMLNYQGNALFNPDLPLGDDSRVYGEGLTDFLTPAWQALERAWEEAEREARFFTNYRATVVSRHLAHAIKPRKKGLLVCEYQLWWALQKALEAPMEKVSYAFRWRDTPGILRIEDPHIAWIHGLLDDYPAVNMVFWNSLNNGSVSSFNKIEAFDALLSRIDRETASRDDERANFSIRNIVTFYQYLRKLTVSHQRFLPEPGLHLFHAALACGGRSFHQAVGRKLLQYPTDFTKETLGFIAGSHKITLRFIGPADIPLYSNDLSYYTGRPLSPEGEKQLAGREAEARRFAVDQFNKKLYPEEEANFTKTDSSGYVRWSLVKDYILHVMACSHARRFCELQAKPVGPRRSRGSLEEGVHWKATLTALARGAKDIYVKHKMHYSGVRMERLDETVPVVFLFASQEEIDKSCATTIHDSNISQRNRELNTSDFPFAEHPKPDAVYSLFYTSRSTKKLTIKHINREELTSLVSLYTLFAMGLERYGAIAKRQDKFQCRCEPSHDPELNTFPKSEIGIAWAIKYALWAVIVVAPQGWRIPERVAEFGRQKNIRILTVPLSIFQRNFLKRLSHLHMISTALKKHPQMEQIVGRFVD